DAGIAFTGHTEFFEERAKASKVVMMLATEELRVALVTTHLPLKAISEAITPEPTARDHHHSRSRPAHEIWHCPAACAGFAGLTRTLAEGGHMGTEEIDTINDAGIAFTGHTEFFEERAKASKVVMMLATEELR
ncbi:hypothetical protein CKQ90_25935, partial [Klebsiella pneumoniae]